MGLNVGGSQDTVISYASRLVSLGTLKRMVQLKLITCWYPQEVALQMHLKLHLLSSLKEQVPLIKASVFDLDWDRTSRIHHYKIMHKLVLLANQARVPGGRHGLLQPARKARAHFDISWTPGFIF